RARTEPGGSPAGRAPSRPRRRTRRPLSTAGEPGVKAAGVGSADQGVRRREALADRRLQPRQDGDDLMQPLLVGPAAEAAPERREAGAEDQRQIEIAGALDNPLLQAAGRLVDHRRHHAVGYGTWIRVLDVGVQPEEAV